MSTAATCVPCRRCGAPLRERALTDRTDHLAGEVELACAFCGTVDRLSTDADRRVLALRVLRAERRWAEDAAVGPALAYLALVERDGLFVAPYAFGAIVVAATTVTGGANTWAAPLSGALAGAALASLAALRLARRRLRTTLTPLVRAAPGDPGQALRCRRCGAALPLAARGFLTCASCEAPNLVPPPIAAGLAAALRDHTHHALLDAAATAAHLRAEGAWVRRLLRGAVVAGAVVGAFAAALVLGGLLR